MYSRVRIEGEFAELWFAGAIPIFQSSFQIAVEKINRRKKTAGVLVLRLDIYRVAKFSLCERKIGLAISDSAKFDEEARIAWMLGSAGFEGLPGLIPPFELGEGQSPIHLQICVFVVRIWETRSGSGDPDCGKAATGRNTRLRSRDKRKINRPTAVQPEGSSCAWDSIRIRIPPARCAMIFAARGHWYRHSPVPYRCP